MPCCAENSTAFVAMVGMASSEGAGRVACLHQARRPAAAKVGGATPGRVPGVRTVLVMVFPNSLKKEICNG